MSSDQQPRKQPSDLEPLELDNIWLLWGIGFCVSLGGIIVILMFPEFLGGRTVHDQILYAILLLAFVIAIKR